MTLEEAKIIASIVETADGGCSVCVGSLVDMLNEQLPQFKWTYPVDYMDVTVELRNDNQ
jgi:hypothetical protein